MKALSLTFKVPESCIIKKHLTLIKSKFIQPNGNCKRNIFLSIYPPIHQYSMYWSIDNRSPVPTVLMEGWIDDGYIDG